MLATAGGMAARSCECDKAVIPLPRNDVSPSVATSSPLLRPPWDERTSADTRRDRDRFDERVAYSELRSGRAGNVTH
jgi:hypothetical protein